MHEKALYASIFSAIIATLDPSPKPAKALDLQGAQQALALISKTAGEICQSPPLEQTSQGVDLSADATAKVGGLVGKLADLGLSGAAQYQTSSSRGVLQKDLIVGISGGNNCRLEVFQTLQVKLVKEPTDVSLIPSESGGNKDCNAASDEEILRPVKLGYEAINTRDLEMLEAQWTDNAIMGPISKVENKAGMVAQWKKMFNETKAANYSITKADIVRRGRGSAEVRVSFSASVQYVGSPSRKTDGDEIYNLTCGSRGRWLIDRNIYDDWKTR